jgi:hypothetical protein
VHKISARAVCKSFDEERGVVEAVIDVEPKTGLAESVDTRLERTQIRTWSRLSFHLTHFSFNQLSVIDPIGILNSANHEDMFNLVARDCEFDCEMRLGK